MSTLYPQANGLPPRRIQKKPRVLSYTNCRFCRDPKVKTKCVWNRCSWPNKCQRCSDKGLSCSEPRRKAEERCSTPRKLPGLSHTTTHSVCTAAGFQPTYMPPMLPVFPELPGLYPLRLSADSMSDGQSTSKELKRPVLKLSGVRCLHHDPGSSFQMTVPCSESDVLDREFLVLMLLSLHGMILMVLEEIISLTPELIRPSMSEKEDVCSRFEKSIDVFVHEYQQLAHQVQQSINELIPHSKLAMEAALDVARFSILPRIPLTATISEKRHNFNNVQEVKERYSQQEHLGMVILLTMYQSTVEIPLDDHERRSMEDHLLGIDMFLLDCEAFFEKLKPFSKLLQALELFTPTRSFRALPSLRSSSRGTASFKDCLGRSVALIKYDAGLPVAEADIWHDNPDRLGRTITHVSCVRNDEEMIDMLLKKRLICTTRTASDFSPLHIIAITGNFEIFKKLHAYYMSAGLLEAVFKEPDANNRTFLELAAGHGHSRIIDLYLSIHKFATEQSERPHSDSHACDSFMDLSGKIKYQATDIVLAFQEALRNDQNEVVLVMRRHLGTYLWDETHRTILWYASHYGRLPVIDILFDLDLMNKPDILGCTPLMAAATAGHEKVLNRLCSLGGYLIGNTKTATRLNDLLDLWRVNAEGKTARDLAVDNGHHECARFLGNMMEIVPIIIQV